MVEVLVALVMAALLTVILLDGASIASGRTARAAQEQRAVLLARNLIMHIRAAPFGVSPSQGTINGLAWTAVERVILRDPRGNEALVDIQLVISDGEGRRLFSAETRRLKRMPRA